jgi:hypothetical protein
MLNSGQVPMRRCAFPMRHLAKRRIGETLENAEYISGLVNFADELSRVVAILAMTNPCAWAAGATTRRTARYLTPSVYQSVQAATCSSGLLWARSGRSTVQNSTNMNVRFDGYRCDMLKVVKYHFPPESLRLTQDRCPQRTQSCRPHICPKR